jgi:hypothetical protein
LLGAFVIACATPPSKEMNQAQGAIDAARAAGAEQFASDEFRAAVDALQRSEQAVTQRDYRQALNFAIESRERAQSAAKLAAGARARAHGDVEVLLAEATTLLTQARSRLRDAEAARLPRKTIQDTRTAIESAQRSVQNARAALNNAKYAEAQKALDGLSPRIRKTIAAIDQAMNTGASKRRR